MRGRRIVGESSSAGSLALRGRTIAGSASFGTSIGLLTFGSFTTAGVGRGGDAFLMSAIAAAISFCCFSLRTSAFFATTLGSAGSSTQVPASTCAPAAAPFLLLALPGFCIMPPSPMLLVASPPVLKRSKRGEGRGELSEFGIR